MKPLYTFVLLCFLNLTIKTTAQVGIGTTSPNNSAQLDITSTNKGVLIPRMTKAQRVAISSPVNSLLVFQTDEESGFYYYNSSTWEKLATNSNLINDVDFYKENTTDTPSDINEDMYTMGNIAIGKNQADYPIDIESDEKGLKIEHTGTTNNNKSGIYINDINEGSGDFLGININSDNFGVNYQNNNKTGINNNLKNPTNETGISLIGINQNIGSNITYLSVHSKDLLHIGINSNVNGGAEETYGFKNIAKSYSGLTYGIYNDTGSTQYNDLKEDTYGLFQRINHFKSPNYKTYGVYNDFYSEESGDNYGVYNKFRYYNTKNIYGLYNEVEFGTTSTVRGVYGVYNNLKGYNSNKYYGMYNIIENSGDDNHYGVKNQLDGVGNGKHYGIYNNLTGNGEDNHYGIYNLMSGNGIGNKYGSYNSISSASNGIHYGTYNNVSTSKGWAGYFLGKSYFSSRISIGETENANTSLNIKKNSSTTSSHIELKETYANDGSRIFFTNAAETDNKWTLFGRADNTDSSSSFNFNYTGVGDILKINGNGKVGVLRTPNTNTFEVNGTASKSTAGSWLANSDSRLKNNINTISQKEALEKILKLRGVTFKWKDSKTGIKRPKDLQFGFIAQEIKEIFPSKVSKDNLGYYQTAYGDYDPFFVQAIKELNHKVETNNKEIINLKKVNNNQKEELELIKKRLIKLEKLLNQK